MVLVVREMLGETTIDFGHLPYLLEVCIPAIQYNASSYQ